MCSGNRSWRRVATTGPTASISTATAHSTYRALPGTASETAQIAALTLTVTR